MNSDAEILFLSDLHLSQSKPEITQQFVSFLKTRAPTARGLYILGDLFEVWVGDDDPAREFDEIFQLLTALSSHTKIYFMHGNRDFLVGSTLARSIGMTMLPDPYVLEIDRQRIALSHGDLLCSDDKEYLEFRRMVRDEKWQHDFLNKSLSQRQSIAAELRDKSKQSMKDKDFDIMDVNAQTVSETLESLNASVLIHGHTHRPAVHRLADGKQRMVLGDWNPEPSFISYQQGRFTLHDHRVVSS